jgi:hypothetical protein
MVQLVHGEYEPSEIDMNGATENIEHNIKSAYPPGFYPAKLLVFVKKEDNHENESISAIINTCKSKSHSMDASCWTERWNLEYNSVTVMAAMPGSDQLERKVIRKPALRVVDVKTIRDRVYAVEESPGLRESLSSDEETTLVVLVKECKKFWPHYFTST